MRQTINVFTVAWVRYVKALMTWQNGQVMWWAQPVLQEYLILAKILRDKELVPGSSKHTVLFL